MAYVITSPCIDVKCGECAEVCPVACIHEGERMYFIRPDDCISCGLCESLCPVDAVYSEEYIPDKDKRFMKINARFFEEQTTDQS